MRVVSHWNRLLKEVVNASPLAVFKARLDRALGDIVQREVSLPIEGGLELDDLKVLSNPNNSMSLWRLQGTGHRAASTANIGIYGSQTVTADNEQATNAEALVVQAPSAA